MQLAPVESAPLRLVASIVLAEIARQVGRERAAPPPAPRAPRYDMALRLMPTDEVIEVGADTLLEF